MLGWSELSWNHFLLFSSYGTGFLIFVSTFEWRDVYHESYRRVYRRIQIAGFLGAGCRQLPPPSSTSLKPAENLGSELPTTSRLVSDEPHTQVKLPTKGGFVCTAKY